MQAGANAGVIRQRIAAWTVLTMLLGTLLSGCTMRRPASYGDGNAAAISGTIQAASTSTVAVDSHDDSQTSTVTSSTALPDVTSSEVSAATIAATAIPPKQDVTALDLAARIATLVDTAPAHVAVEIADSNGNSIYQHNGDDLYDAASLYKLGIMVQVYADRDAGELTFDDPVTLYPDFFSESDEVYSPDSDMYANVPVGELLVNLITLSSNVAAEALLNLVGTDSVNQTMVDLGLPHTKILWSPSAAIGPSDRSATAAVAVRYEETLHAITARSEWATAPFSGESSADGAYDVTTASDIAHLFTLLLAGRVVSPAASAEMLHLLSQQQINDRLPADLPDGTVVAHKTGDLDGLLHDAGVIYAPAGPIVVVILTDEITDHDAIIDLMRRIAVLAFEYVRN